MSVDLLPIVRVIHDPVEEALLGAVHEPDIGALGLEGHHNPVDQLGGRIEALTRDHLAGLLVHEHGDGHAPGALAGHHPVGARIDHALDALLALRRHEARLVDGFQRAGPQRVAAIEIAIQVTV